MNKLSQGRGLFLGALALLFTACTPGAHSIVSSSTDEITVAYDAYGMTPTLTSEAQGVAQRHCDQYYKDASYSGARIPNPLLTLEWHDFQCVERPINTNIVLAALDRAIDSSPAMDYRAAYLDCLRENIVALDDLASDASNVALAISDVCGRQHWEYVNDVVSQLDYSDEIRSIIRDSFDDSAGVKVIPYVLNWRKIVQDGFDKAQSPSKQDLPNKLYQARVEISL